VRDACRSPAVAAAVGRSCCPCRLKRPRPVPPSARVGLQVEGPELVHADHTSGSRVTGSVLPSASPPLARWPSKPPPGLRDRRQGLLPPLGPNSPTPQGNPRGDPREERSDRPPVEKGSRSGRPPRSTSSCTATATSSSERSTGSKAGEASPPTSTNTPATTERASSSPASSVLGTPPPIHQTWPSNSTVDTGCEPGSATLSATKLPAPRQCGNIRP